MSEIDKIKARLGRNSFNRAEIGVIGQSTRGELMRGRSLRADHKRSVAEAGGYPSTITLRMHYDMAYRNGLGSNLAFGIVNDTWRVAPVIFDGDEDAERRANNPTEFERAVDEHFERLDIWNRLKGLDKYQRPMRYGALMYVTSEKNLVNTRDPLTRLPTMDYLVDLRVYHEAQLQVSSAVQNPANINYGRPLIYDLKTNVAGSTNEWEDSGYQIHASRVYAYGEGALDGSIYGVPCLESCFEALMDSIKVRMAGAEGFFQNASNKYAIKLQENSSISDAEIILDNMADFDNGISNSVATTDSISLMQTTLSDPTNPWTIAVNECAAAHSKPITILIGHQTGERASGEDITTWNRVIMDRQEQIGNQMIIGLIDDLTEKFSFPRPSKKMNIVWRDLNESTAEQQVDLGLKRVQTNKEAKAAGMLPVYSTEFIQKEAGAPIASVIVLDNGGEDDLQVGDK